MPKFEFVAPLHLHTIPAHGEANYLEICKWQISNKSFKVLNKFIVYESDLPI